MNIIERAKKWTDLGNGCRMSEPEDAWDAIARLEKCLTEIERRLIALETKASD